MEQTLEGYAAPMGKQFLANGRGAPGTKGARAAETGLNEVQMAMQHNILWLHVGVDEHPFATFFDGHQRYRVLSYSQIRASSSFPVALFKTIEGNPPSWGMSCKMQQLGVEALRSCATPKGKGAMRS